MKIAISTDNADYINLFLRKIKESGHELINAKVETALFECIETNSADGYIISSNFSYSKKAIDFIKKANPYTPIILIIEQGSVFHTTRADMAVMNHSEFGMDGFVSMVFYNLIAYLKNFETLNKLTSKMHDVIEFGHCKYDPTRRMLSYKDKEVKKLSTKQGGVLEILAINYGTVVKKEIILEKVWHKSDYFAGRSMDVYITHLRNVFSEAKIDVQIKNISNIGLILE